MAINKVVYGVNILIDLTADTVTADKMAAGVVAHAKDGSTITGTAAVSYDAENEGLIMPEGFVVVEDE